MLLFCFRSALGAILNGILEWMTYVVQLVFPIFNIFLFCFAFTCLDFITNTLQVTDQGVTRCDCIQYIDEENCTMKVAFSRFSYNTTTHNEDGKITFDCPFVTDTLKKATSDNLIDSLPNDNFFDEDFFSDVMNEC